MRTLRGTILALASCALAAGSVCGAEGFFRVRQKENGVWTFVDPDGNDFFLRAVDHIGGEGEKGDLSQVKDRM